ncbi:hypothetical protein [Mesorhizobium sp. M0678]|uniref:hypothetical protein n=1 Tax=Mesorhizobium sp. M0678 TaxID=2956985 RepID=UPI0033396405
MLICANLIKHAFTNSQIVRAEASAIETPARHLRAFEAAARAKEAGLRKKRESLSDCSRLQALLSRLQQGRLERFPRAHHGACERREVRVQDHCFDELVRVALGRSRGVIFFGNLANRAQSSSSRSKRPWKMRQRKQSGAARED